MRKPMNEWRLLREYVEENSQAAFARLVERYINLVYSTCLREVHDPSLAEDVTQVVFLVLAQKGQEAPSAANPYRPGCIKRRALPAGTLCKHQARRDVTSSRRPRR